MTFTKEQLQHIIETDHVQCGDASALARMALAGMEAEPVGVTDKSEIECLKRGEMANVMPPDYKGCDSGDSVYLYDAPQPLTTSERAELQNYRNAQQVVPGDITGPLAHAYKELTPHFMRNHISVFERYGIYPDGSAGIQAMRIALDVMERRAAMQSGAVKDGWVACSERMPSAGDYVLAYRPDAPESNDPLIKMAKYIGRSAHGHGFDCYCKPTHWMPLPAAPQQEVK